eukprot:CAMPEP_0196139054 /NCGR_PEP_ID=MMETSP0910-20130528/6465_1 /TAXON_ID=49265 /ORGANISM="Thalassiosira rotula, Strain GSO102" /LENGTH=397 /DNA_ID=CAMNT_0041399733 /DNA_START=92 /DNA_END=1285 /DNA_ORIENTATION=-
MTSMLGKSVFAMVAIRSCGTAFVAIAPRSMSTRILSDTIRSSSSGARHSRTDHVVPTQTNPKPDPLFVLKQRGTSSSSSYSSSFSGAGDDVSFSSVRMRSATKPLVVCGPSGVGKGTIIAKFMERQNDAIAADRDDDGNSNSKRQQQLPKFGFSVSHTTRQPRPGEVDGVHYHFVTRQSMLNKIESGSFFIEHAEVHGNLYGTSFRAIFDVSNNVDDDDDGESMTTTTATANGNDVDNAIRRHGQQQQRQCLLDIDVEGVRSIKEFQTRQRRKKNTAEQLSVGEGGSSSISSSSSSSSTNAAGQLHLEGADDIHLTLPELDANFIFIAPPSAEALRERLEGRGTETPETLERRFRNAKAELEYGMEPGNFDAVVVNDDLERACAEFARIVEEMYAVN